MSNIFTKHATSINFAALVRQGHLSVFVAEIKVKESVHSFTLNRSSRPRRGVAPSEDLAKIREQLAKVKEDILKNAIENVKSLSGKAKTRGNEAFQRGNFQKSTYHYSMAIRLDPGNHVNYSNRSASHASQGKWQNALEDAEKCIRLAPDWGKGFARKAAALLGMGQAGEALKVYKAGLKAEPGNVACKNGIASAKESIRMHQQRYEDMWGKSSPASSS